MHYGGGRAGAEMMGVSCAEEQSRSRTSTAKIEVSGELGSTSSPGPPASTAPLHVICTAVPRHPCLTQTTSPADLPFDCRPCSNQKSTKAISDPTFNLPSKPDKWWILMFTPAWILI